MSFRVLHKLVTYAMGGLGLLALSFGGELSPASLVILLLGYGLSWFGERLRKVAENTGLTATRVLLALLVIQAARGAFSGAWLSLAMEFSGWLTISRLANRRTGADHQQVAMLAFVQLIAATVLTSDLGFGLLFLAYVLVTPWALSLSHLQTEIEHNYPEREQSQRGADVARVLSSRRIVGPPFLGAMALLSVPTLLTTLAMFVLFPRIGLGFIGLGKGRSESVAGFGDQIELGGFGVIRDDATVVLRVSAGGELAADDRLRSLRLRGTAFDHYDGRRWTRTTSNATRLGSVGDYYPLRRFPGKQDVTLRITLERIDEPVLFFPTSSVGFRLPSRGTGEFGVQQASILRAHGFDYRYQTRDEQGLVYDVLVGNMSSDRDLPEAHDLEAGIDFLSVPSGHERVRELAESVRGPLRDPVKIAEKFTRFLRDEGGYTYTLEQPDTRGRNPLEVFLFEARRGHCEYFATALAIMLRSVGVPARNVTGFIGGEYNRFGDYYGVRQGDAHSWVEVLAAERGWVTFDPTPSISSDFGPGRGVFASVSDAVDALRTYWSRRVVSYDLRDQLRGARKISAFFQKFRWFSSAPTQARSTPSELRSWLSRGLSPALAWGLGSVLVLLGLALIGRWLARRGRGQLPVSVHRVRRLYASLLRELARRGHRRAEHVTPGQFAAQLAAEATDVATLTGEITQVFERVRYGDDSVSAGELHALETRLRGLRRSA